MGCALSYHRTVPPGAKILGGKRITCPASRAVRTVRIPATLVHQCLSQFDLSFGGRAATTY